MYQFSSEHAAKTCNTRRLQRLIRLRGQKYATVFGASFDRARKVFLTLCERLSVLIQVNWPENCCFCKRKTVSGNLLNNMSYVHFYQFIVIMQQSNCQAIMHHLPFQKHLHNAAITYQKIKTVNLGSMTLLKELIKEEAPIGTWSYPKKYSQRWLSVGDQKHQQVVWMQVCESILASFAQDKLSKSLKHFSELFGNLKSQVHAISKMPQLFESCREFRNMQCLIKHFG